MINFDEMIDNHLKREQYAKAIGRYYPSDIGRCLRKTWYSYKSPIEIGPDLVKIFHLGNILHDFVVQVLQSEKNPEVELLKYEFPFKVEIDDFLISGRVDDLILVKLSGKSVLVEVKSTKSIDFVTGPKDPDASQLILYMFFTGVHNGILLYVDRRDLKSRVFEVPFDEEKAKKIIDRFRALHKNLVSDTSPDPEARESLKTLWQCRYCEYRERCYEQTPKSEKWM